MDPGSVHTMPAAGAPPRAAARLDFTDTLKDGWTLFTRDWLALSVGIVLALVLSIIPPLVLAPVVWTGVARMVLRRVREGRPAEISDVFSCFDRFFGLWGVTLVVTVVVLALLAVAALPLVFAGGFETGADGQLEPQAVGAILVTVLLFFVMLVPMAYLSTIWVYAYYLVVDESRCGVFESLATSRRLVHGSGFWMTFLLVLVTSLIASTVNNVVGSLGALAGLVTLGIGWIPFFFIGMVPYAYVVTSEASMYFQARGERDLLPSAAVAPTGWPAGSAPVQTPGVWSAPAAPRTPPGYPPGPSPGDAPGSPPSGGAAQPQEGPPPPGSPPSAPQPPDPPGAP